METNEYSPTDEQQAIIDAQETLIAVTALAGTGKTSTLRGFAKARKRESILYLVFNKAMEMEAKQKFADCPNVTVSTFHALAFKYEGRKYAGKIGNIRPWDIQAYMRSAGISVDFDSTAIVFESINGFLRSASPDVESYLYALPLHTKKHIAYSKIRLDRLADIVNRVWSGMGKDAFPMTHNAYLKLFQLSKPNLGYRWIMIDEAQDLSDCMVDCIARDKAGRILVGDPYQQIYAWNGAVNALEKIKKFGAAEYYLTNSFRCPVDVATLANKYLCLLEAPKTFRGCDSPQNSNDDALVVGRTNVGLFDFVSGKFDKYSIYYNGGFHSYEFNLLLDIHRLKHGQLSTVSNGFIKQFKSFTQLKDYSDHAKDLTLKPKIKIVEAYGKDLPQIYSGMESCQARNREEADVVVSTAHKVKGQEYSSVMLLDDYIDISEQIGRAYACFTHEKSMQLSMEEIHLLYVSFSRSTKEVYYNEKYNITNNLIKEFNELVSNNIIELI